MKRIFTSLLICFFVAVGAFAQTGAEILKSASDKIHSSKSLYVDYKLTTEGHSLEGHLTLAGDKFTIVSPQVRTWFDGKTQWTYSTSIGEINITEPTKEELCQVNPFAILKSFSTDYTLSKLPSKIGFKKVQLKAKNEKSDISKAEVTVSESTGYPTQVILTLSSGQKVTINISKVQPGGELPVATFRFNAKDYPKIQVIDLR